MISKATKGISFENFENDDIKTRAVVRSLEIIGEASKNIPESMKKECPEISWIDIIGMRNRLSHEYFGVNLGIVWRTIKQDIPQIKSCVEKLKDKI